MLSLVIAGKTSDMGKRDAMRRSHSEVETFRKCESAKGQFGSFEIISYTPLTRKRTTILGFKLRKSEQAAETSSIIDVASNRLLSSKSSASRQSAALDLLATSPYRSRKPAQPQRDKSPERVGKVFLSERQSRNFVECGSSFPGAPPATPTPMLLQRTEYVPSMTDIRAQRSLQDRLQSMKNVQKAKAEKQRREAARQEKNAEVERVKDEKRQQRRIIYALNEIMTRAENARFQEFIEKNGFGS